jgi:NADPH:quinone reductase-like Zn-dependent oxidoreductase
MRAWTMSTRGSPTKNIALQSSHPMPSPPTGSQLLIQISHAGLNPVDLIISSAMPTWLPFRRSPIPAFDFAGTVAAAGPKAMKEYAPGTSVCGTLTFFSILIGKGTLAEYVLVEAETVAKKPKNMSAAQAAGLGIAGQTAAIMIEKANIKRGDRVLVNGSSGGVGSIVVQIAKGLGAHVTATCSEGNFELVKRLGADEIVDYRKNAPIQEYFKTNNSDEKQKFDHILDTIRSQPLYEHSASYLKPSGLYINIGASGTQLEQIFARFKNGWVPTWLGGTPRKWVGMGLMPAGKLQRQVCKWVEEGIIKEVPVDSELAFEDVRQVCGSQSVSMTFAIPMLMNENRATRKLRVSTRGARLSLRFTSEG